MKNSIDAISRYHNGEIKFEPIAYIIKDDMENYCKHNNAKPDVTVCGIRTALGAYEKGSIKYRWMVAENLKQQGRICMVLSSDKRTEVIPMIDEKEMVSSIKAAEKKLKQPKAEDKQDDVFG